MSDFRRWRVRLSPIGSVRGKRMWTAKATELEPRTWWKTKRRLLSAIAIFILAALAFFMLSPMSFVYVRTDTDGRHSGSSPRRPDFSWNWSLNHTLNDVNVGGTKKLPHALLIGAKKAGTRALLEFIRVHPNVRAAGHEVHFFDKNYSNGLDWYRDMMPTSIAGQITMEKTPSYLITPEAPKRVYELNPDMKLIVVLKDPVDRAISDYTQSYTKHKAKRSFQNSVFEDPAALVVNQSRPSVHTGVYYVHLKRWMEYFPLKQFCFINGENMVVHPAEELGKLQQFLRLKRIITEDYFYFNSTKGFPCLKKREASGVPHCLGNGKGRAHPDVSLEAKVALYRYYAPYNRALYDLTGIDFGWERKNPLELLNSE